MAQMERANEVRLARADIKRRVREPRSLPGSADVLASVLEESVPRELAGMTLDALLLCVFRAPRARRALWVAETGASPMTIVGRLTDRQRTLLVDALRLSPDDLSARVAQRRGRAA